MGPSSPSFREYIGRNWPPREFERRSGPQSDSTNSHSIVMCSTTDSARAVSDRRVFISRCVKNVGHMPVGKFSTYLFHERFSNWRHG